ncbi:MAG TPA: VOC family protein [Vicinamibacterales bacterium]
MSDYRGRFVWHELMTTDTKSAGAFYSKIIGWKTQPWGKDLSGGEYTLFVSGKRQLAGLMVIPDDAKKMGVPPNWFTYIGTDDVDETARLAASLGGTVQRAPADIPDTGRFAVLQDPQGAVFGIFKSKQPSGGDGVPDVGDFSWHELATTDAKAAFDFYRRLFGWVETSAMDMGPMGVYQMFGQSKDRPLGGLFNKPKEMPGPPMWLPYIRIPDARKSAEAIAKAGAKVINGPMEVPGGDWITQGMDLHGAMFAVHSIASAPAAAAPATSSGKATAPARKAVKKKAAPAKKKTAPAKKKTAPAKKKSVKKAVKKAAGKKAQPARKATTKKKSASKRRR